jgi:Tol biopolymer transport system component
MRLVRVLLWLGGLSLILSSGVLAMAQGASPLPPMLVEAGELYLVGADGTGMRLVYSGPQDIFSSTWSPGGQWIAFSLQYNAVGGELHRVRANGRDVRRVLSQDIIQFYWDSGPLAWSPDGRRLAVVGGLDDNSGSDIFLVDARTGQSERLNLLINSQHLMWSPDGQWIAMLHTIYRKEGESRVLYRVSVDGHAREQITHFNTGDSVWSPDGQWISFLAYHWCGLALYRMRADGSNIQMITEVPRRWDLPLVHRSWAGANTSIRREMYLDMYDIVWSPDSQWIAFDTGYIGVNGLPEPDSLDIYRVRASGGPAERLTDNTVNDWRPQWSPDGQ